MLKRALLIYKKKNRLNWDEVAKQLELSRRGLNNIFENKSPNIKVITHLKIKAMTGLEPWDYLDGLDALKKIIQNNERIKTIEKES